MKKQLLPLCLLGLSIGIFSCNRGAPIQGTVWVPKYLDRSAAREILSKPPQAVVNGGKIYAWQNLVFQLEPNAGIHVYKLVNKTPQPYKFIQVYGAQEISIRGNYLYTNNFSDIVTLDISDLNAVQEKSRVPNTFSLGTSNLPPQQGYFQCVDTTKGIVVGWEKKNNIEATCKY